MRRVVALRVSLLASLGLLPLACGDDGAGPDDGTSEAGAGGEPIGVGTGGGGAAGGGAGAGGEGRVRDYSKCTSPMADAATGLVKCAEGYLHRPEVRACGEASGAGGDGAGGDGAKLPRADGSVECAIDGAPSGGAGGGGPGDCGAFEYGFCHADSIYDVCESGCISDQDCGPNRLCLCGHPESPTGGICVGSNCTTDADCASGLLCASYVDVCGGTNFACQTPADQCMVDSDCPEGDGPCEIGEYAPGKESRVCDDAVCGRPFLVDAANRVAAPVCRGDWSEAMAQRPCLEQLSNAERMRQAEHFTRMGQMEHASIAAFARFQLQLLALGAPSALVEACTAAMADETRHTKLCFALASHYAERPIGPGPLDIEGSLASCSLLEVVDLVLAEGCIGETNAALEALELADAATDPVLRDVYAIIARDEERHAELAFRFIDWALSRDVEGVGARIQQVLTSLPTSVGARSITGPCLTGLLSRHSGSLAA